VGATISYTWYANDTSNNWGNSGIQTLITTRYAVIDQAFVSDGRADVGSVQTVGFHAKWDSGADIAGENIYVNNTLYVTNATGWVAFSVTSSVAGSENWIVTGVNFTGTTLYTQTAPTPRIVWDQIKITDGGMTENQVSLGETTTIWYKAIYAYDNSSFGDTSGILYVNASAMSWSSINNRWEYAYTANTGGTATFVASGMSDNLYNLTSMNDTVGPQILTIVFSPFSIISNSTISELAFNSTSEVLSFTVSGPPGTTGFTNVTIAKTLIGNINALDVYLDGNETNYTISDMNYSWLIHFTYHHSTHKVLIALGSIQAESSIETSANKTIAICIAMAAILPTALLITKRRKRRARDGEAGKKIVQILTKETDANWM
jgi:hypothetical protein